MTGWLIRAAATVAGLYALDSLLYAAVYDGEVASAVIGDVWLKLAVPTLVQLFTQLVLVVALPSPPGRAEVAGA